MRNKLVSIGVMSFLLLSIAGCTCQGTIPAPLRKPVQEAVEQAVKTPGIDLYVNILGLSQGGLNVTIEARISNRNSVTLDIGNLQIVAKGETGHTYIRDTFTGGSIAPNSSRTFAHNIVIPLDVLSERKMITTVDSRAGAAGVTLPITATVTVSLPEIQNLITAPQVTIYAEPKIAATFPLPSLKILIDTTVANSNNFGLIIGDLQINMYRSDGTLVKQTTIPGGNTQALSTRTFSGSVPLGSEILRLIGSDYLTIKLNSQAGISGINDKIPLEVNIILSLPHLP